MRYYHSLTTGFFCSVLCVWGSSLLHSHHYTAGFQPGVSSPPGTCFGTCTWQCFGGPILTGGCCWHPVAKVMNIAEHFPNAQKNLSQQGINCTEADTLCCTVFYSVNIMVFYGNRWGNSGNSVRLYFGGLQNHCRW